MFQLELLVFLALRMEIDPRDRPHDLIEADVVEALEAGSRDTLDAVVGD